MPAAYKDFDEVMEAQSDLVDVTHRLTPLSVIKG
jgi:RNA-splicing ligase RtcB